MTDEQINKAIAEACGWEQITQDNKPEEIWEHKNPPYMCRVESKIPDYLNDLNAMHEAEKMLNRESGYHEIGGYGLYLVALEHNASATARQRAEAFLRAIGRWEEEA